jgi:hypothetical protein
MRRGKLDRPRLGGFSVLVVWQHRAVGAVARKLTINLLTEYRLLAELSPSLSI